MLIYWIQERDIDNLLNTIAFHNESVPTVYIRHMNERLSHYDLQVKIVTIY
jgi:hypothetical protein